MVLVGRRGWAPVPALLLPRKGLGLRKTVAPLAPPDEGCKVCPDKGGKVCEIYICKGVQPPRVHRDLDKSR
jgi:hypothetical protein